MSKLGGKGAIVETVKPESQRGEGREKTERLPVLEGLRKYASVLPHDCCRVPKVNLSSKNQNAA